MNKVFGISFLAFCMTLTAYAGQGSNEFVNETGVVELFNSFKKEFATDFASAKLKNVKYKLSSNEKLVAFAQEPFLSMLFNSRVIKIGYPFIKEKLSNKTTLVTLVLCHETGHLLGGSPTVRFEMNERVLFSTDAAEGQADYWAAKVCMPRMLALAHGTIHDMGKASFEYSHCSAVYENVDQQKNCMLTIQASLDLFQILQSSSNVSSNKVRVSYDTPSSNEVDATLLGAYPSFQCRLDTMIAGALNRERPRCWFKPEKD